MTRRNRILLEQFGSGVLHRTWRQAELRRRLTSPGLDIGDKPGFAEAGDQPGSSDVEEEADAAGS